MKRAALRTLHSATNDYDESGVRERSPSMVSAEPIAAGGMAAVHLVAGPRDGRLYALKRLHPHLASDGYWVSMLHDEANIASSIRHENVVATHGMSTYRGAPCLVMDYVPGLSAADVIRYASPHGIPVVFALKIAADALRGLHAAHETCDASGRPLAIVHRDVSPQNILVGADGIARVLDFGIAKALHRLQSTRPGEVKGKLAYMSPEQLSGEDLDRRTDVRAIGVVLWELLTSSPLFHSRREQESIDKILRNCVRRPSELNPDVPADIDAIVMRALAIRPQDRFQSALEMALAIEAYCYRVTAEQLAEFIGTIGHDVLDDRARRGADLRDSVAPPPPPPAPPSVHRRLLAKLNMRMIEPALWFLSAILVSASFTFYVRARARIIRK
jgi:serine/threonine-protein kinase